MARISADAGRLFVFDEGNRAGDRARVAGQHALGQRRAHEDALRESSRQQLPRDHEPLNLAGAFADGGELDVAEEFLGRIVLHEPVAAVDLHAVVGGLDGNLAGVELGHRRFERRATPRVLRNAAR